ncbi:hypothetical protein EIN_181740 [Entamoeba invadens IP1]|uniref:hypothetical protein n=1 Tax=Entamoeba invadens IP1 TaxID=370355 RepID=UPI0002C3F63E|nr:hypothetical protein EIN_181740 [Entamoeba invadens IP1]ELP93997.1 hypothetical protein EIN_181740 [Entamoeba invadens IP1]|eukprot:XP_004260768.1 hypothetical protein EIN_181740 [Entamoeba invadens IP1]
MQKRVGTHDGQFHIDETTGVALLQLTTEYNNLTVFRSRDMTLLSSCDLVLDVGRVYNHKLRRYDHHQRGFSETWDETSVVKLSSSGLILKHYGKEVISHISSEPSFDPLKDDKEVDWFLNKWYYFFFVSIDGEDNGIPQTVNSLYCFEFGSLRSTISTMNSSRSKGFFNAVKVASCALLDSFYRLYFSWRPTAQKYPPESFSQSIRVIEDDDADWCTLCEMASMGKTKIVVRKEGDKYFARPAIDQKGCGLKWPKLWRGLYGSKLHSVAGNNTVYCDKSGVELVLTNVDDINTFEKYLIANTY